MQAANVYCSHKLNVVSARTSNNGGQRGQLHRLPLCHSVLALMQAWWSLAAERGDAKQRRQDPLGAMGEAQAR